MNVMEWSKSNVDYGRKLVDSALEGARRGEGEFLKEESLASFLSESARQSLAPAAIGACWERWVVTWRPGGVPEPEPSSVRYWAEQSRLALA